MSGMPDLEFIRDEDGVVQVGSMAVFLGERLVWVGPVSSPFRLIKADRVLLSPSDYDSFERFVLREESDADG